MPFPIPLATASASSQVVSWIIVLGGAAAAVMLYIVPMRTAKKRNHPAFASIAVLNILLGWTLVGWAVAMAWAVSPIKKDEKYR